MISFKRMGLSLTLLSSVLLTNCADPNGSEVKAQGNYSECSQILSQSLYNVAQESTNTDVNNAYKYFYLTLTDDKAYDEYSRAFDESKSGGTNVSFLVGGIGSALGGGTSDKKLTRQEHDEKFKQLKTLNNIDAITLSESSLASLVQTYVRDSASVQAWEACVTKSPEIGLYAYGSRDAQNNASLRLLWNPGTLAGSVPQVDVSVLEPDGVKILPESNFRMALGTGVTVNVKTANSDNEYEINANAVTIGGLGNFTAKAIIPTLKPREIISLPKIDEYFCSDASADNYGAKGSCTFTCKNPRARNYLTGPVCEYGYFYGHANGAPGIRYVWPSPWNQYDYVYCDIPNHDMLIRGLTRTKGKIENIGHEAGAKKWAALYWSQPCTNDIFEHHL
ncbi:MAG: hypothetical protein EOP04_06895 [Proteobacteria bacterium]|nr:MAG: hypothetical protein EOP04_06895 [Pseudomonadota bacterium]